MNLEILKTRFSKRILVLVVLILAGIVIAVLLQRNLLVAGRRQIQQLHQEVNAVQGELAQRTMMLKELEDFEEEQLEMESRILKIRELIPYEIDTSEFMEFLGELSYELDFEDMRVDILPLTEAEADYFRRDFRVRFQASYLDIDKFFQALQGIPYLVNIDIVEIKRNPQAVPLIEVSARISAIQASPEE